MDKLSSMGSSTSTVFREWCHDGAVVRENADFSLSLSLYLILCLLCVCVSLSLSLCICLFPTSIISPVLAPFLCTAMKARLGGLALRFQKSANAPGAKAAPADTKDKGYAYVACLSPGAVVNCLG